MATCLTPDGLLYGDPDGDGVVTSFDAILMNSFIVGNIDFTPEQEIQADVNGDGFIDALDVTLVLQYVDGVIDTFPVCRKWKAAVVVLGALGVAVTGAVLMTLTASGGRRD